MKVFYFGYPGVMGGANTEMLHTIPVWRQAGIDVTLVPTWGQDAVTEERMTALGCETLHVKPSDVQSIPGLPGSICVSFCNSHFWEVFATLQRLGCKTVWSGCMCFEFDQALNVYRQYGLPNVHHFQSAYQQQQITEALGKFGKTPNGRLIRGAFDFSQVQFGPRQHGRGEDFVVGRLARQDEDKWSSNHWNILGAVPYDKRRSLNMGWTQQQARKCGPPPPWSECLPPMHVSTAEFLSRCHAMIGLNGGAAENWPRVGLEAMAAGVPLVCQNLFGWREMIEHGRTGYLFDTDREAAYYLAKLAHEEETRLDIAHNARAAVESLADPAVIGGQWRELFASLTEEKAVAA